MKFHLTTAAGRNLITAYGPGYVTVNQDRHEQSLIVMAEELITEWPPGSVGDLLPEHMRALTDRDLEIVLIGTGSKLRFPAPEIMRPLMEARLGFEVMDVQAACRTYNILVDEERRVAAALLLN